MHMNKKAIALFVAIAIFAATLVSAFIVFSQPKRKTLIVPENYAMVSWALGNATAGDTVYVKSGTYNERSFSIDKPLSLIGEDKFNTILIGGVEGITGGGSTISVKTDNVTVSGFTIRSYDFKTPAWYFFGIYVGGDYCNITGNIIENCQSGIWNGDPPKNVSSDIILKNTISNNLEAGIELDDSPHNIMIAENIVASNFLGLAVISGDSFVISENTVVNNGGGAYFGASDSTIVGNNFTSNRNRDGVALNVAGSNNTFVYNYIADNVVGATFSGSAANDNMFYNNDFINNNENTKITFTVYNETWDNGSVGNYWSDYTAKYPSAEEIDNTGIWNTPYVIDANNTDFYPRVKRAVIVS